MGAADVTKTHLWDGADVFYALQSGTAPTWPATAADPFPATLKQVGILDGDDGFTEGRSEDENDFYGWGGLLLRTSRAHFKMTRTFTLLEDNAETRALIYPGSAAGKISVPKPVPVWLAFELRDGTAVHRVWTEGHAICKVNADIKWGETDITKYPILATIYPTGAGVLFSTQDSSDVVPTAWAATTAYAVSDQVTITGATLEATVAGTSGSTEPTAPAAINDTVVDGTVTWKRIA